MDGMFSFDDVKALLGLKPEAPAPQTSIIGVDSCLELGLSLEVCKPVCVVSLMVSAVAAQVLLFFAFFALRDAIAWSLSGKSRVVGGLRGIADTGKDSNAVKTMVVLGSGGHTAEMLRVVKFMDLGKYSPRVYVVSTTDLMSAERVRRFERGRAPPGAEAPPVNVVKIPRSREVGQSYLTSIFTTLRSLLASIFTVLTERPKLLVCNGPGTCLPVCISLRLLRPLSSKIVFVESICRTRTLSLTGRIIYYLRIADTLFVQWTELCEKYPRTTYCGRVY